MTQPRRPLVGASDFDGTRLTVARRLRAMSKADLARAVDVTPTAVAQYEKGARPTQSVQAQICLVLGMPREFFGAGAPLALLPAAGAHFRSLRSTSSKAREQVLAYGELSLQLVDLLAEYVDLPAVDLPDLKLPGELTSEVIEDAATQVRERWGVAAGPLPSVVQLLEAHGIIVLRLPDSADPRVDALSTWAGDRPLVFLNPRKDDKARSRFDGAHELGHLLLHPDTEPGSKLVEQQANAFASALLMPRSEIFDQLPHRLASAARSQAALGSQSPGPRVPSPPTGAAVRCVVPAGEPAACAMGPARAWVPRTVRVAPGVGSGQGLAYRQRHRLRRCARAGPTRRRGNQ